MSTSPGSTFDAMAETSDGAPDAVLLDPLPPGLGCTEPEEGPPGGERLDTALDPWCHRPWPMPTPPTINKMAPINRATAVQADFRPVGASDRGRAQYGFGSAQAECHDPVPPMPGGGGG